MHTPRLLVHSVLLLLSPVFWVVLIVYVLQLETQVEDTYCQLRLKNMVIVAQSVILHQTLFLIHRQMANESTKCRNFICVKKAKFAKIIVGQIGMKSAKMGEEEEVVRRQWRAKWQPQTHTQTLLLAKSQ